MLPVSAYADEHLLSWLLRASKAQGLGLTDGLVIFAGYRKSPFAIDYQLQTASLTRLSKTFGQPPIEFRRRTTGRESALLRDACQLEGGRPFMRPLPSSHQDNRHPWIQFCPACLNDKPYFRKHWRYSFVTHCHIHKTKLAECCECCQAPVNPTQLLYRELYQCHHCGSDLRQQSTNQTTGESIQLQQVLLGALANNRNLAVFRLLRKLLSYLYAEQHLANHEPPHGLAFDSWPISARSKAMGLAAHLLSNWPRNLERLLANANMELSSARLARMFTGRSRVAASATNDYEPHRFKAPQSRHDALMDLLAS